MPVLTFVFIILLFCDIFFTQYLLKRIKEKDKQWYKKERGPISSLIYKNFGIKKGFIIMIIIGLFITIAFLYFSLILSLEVESILNPRVFYTISLVFLITLYSIVIGLNTHLFKSIKNSRSFKHENKKMP